MAELRDKALAELGQARGGDALSGEIARSVAGDRGGASSTWIAMLEDVAVGFAHASLRGDEGKLEAIWVEPGAREIGLGSSLLEAATAWLEARGARTIDASALPGDRSTKRLLETAGFVARLIVMRREPALHG